MKKFIMAPNFRIAQFYMRENEINPYEITYIPAIPESIQKFRGVTKGELIFVDAPGYPRHGIVSELLAMAEHRGIEVKTCYC